MISCILFDRWVSVCTRIGRSRSSCSWGSSASAFVSLRSDLVKSSDLRLPTTPHCESKTIFMSDPQNIQDMTFTTWLLGFQSVYKWVFKVWPMGRGDDSRVLNAVIPELPDLTQFLSSLSTSNLTNCNDHRRKWKIFFFIILNTFIFDRIMFWKCLFSWGQVYLYNGKFSHFTWSRVCPHSGELVDNKKSW